MRLLRIREVVSRLGVSRVTLWRWERAGLFPARRRLGPNAVGWLENEIDEWISSRERVIQDDASERSS